ncbi:MAG TPA: Lrp/AsnC family transcriptional regulator [Alphaproteobacteria bacterium]|nr:Lrp/AsnC family transcriptional regulator [Alphaproteobacteria bacterium]
MDAVNRHIINAFQGGFPISEWPFAEAATRVGIEEDELIERIEGMLEAGTLTRFGPLYNAEAMGGALTLAALAVPVERYDEVADIVNAFHEVAHNYAREHAFNMWFVIATDDPARARAVIEAIEAKTGLIVYDMPKEEEFYIGLHFTL